VWGTPVYYSEYYCTYMFSSAFTKLHDIVHGILILIYEVSLDTVNSLLLLRTTNVLVNNYCPTVLGVDIAVVSDGGQLDCIYGHSVIHCQV
jgi:hypothetical protein